jgi:hypothetical protein
MDADMIRLHKRVDEWKNNVAKQSFQKLNHDFDMFVRGQASNQKNYFVAWYWSVML